MGEEITLAPFQRIDLDHVVIGLALRLPQLLPHELTIDQVFENWGDIRDFSAQFVNHLRQIEEDHKILADYVRIAEERGWGNIRVIEGVALTVPWFYTTVKSMHKTKNHAIVEVSLYKDGMVIGDEYHETERGIEILNQGWTSLG